MNFKLCRVLRIIICLFCWLTISPLFYSLSGKWGFERGRLFLTLVSPLFLMLYFIFFVWGYFTYMDYQRKYYFIDEGRIERITGVKCPEMNIIEYHQSRTSFTGDYSDQLIVEFEEDISEKTFQTLDSLVIIENTGWRNNRDAYVYSVMWGNGMPTPEGENREEDRIFSLTIKKGSNKATINSGMW